MRLGYIDYLNCYPFYYHMFERESIGGVKVIPGYPTDLNRMMIFGELDMSPISAATCAEMNGQILLLPDSCLSSVGYVGSVVLRSKVPIEDLHRRTVGLSRASYTSVLLLKILLQRYYDIEPVYRTTDPNPTLDGMDAALLIGNEAMVGSHQPVSYSYDLGELWLRKTGSPVVFAVFAVRQSAIEKHSSRIRAVLHSYHDSLHCLEAEREKVLAGAQGRYPDIMYDVNAYYRTLQFDFTDTLKDALTHYLDLAAELGLVDERAQLTYLQLNRDLPE
ncbi:MAG: menaquinone biosynthesis protein [Dehalococcoidia bacterium]